MYQDKVLLKWFSYIFYYQLTKASKFYENSQKHKGYVLISWNDTLYADLCHPFQQIRARGKRTLDPTRSYGEMKINFLN